jgi:hypothetical protein
MPRVRRNRKVPLITGSNRSLRSLGRANARPLTKRNQAHVLEIPPCQRAIPMRLSGQAGLQPAADMRVRPGTHQDYSGLFIPKTNPQIAGGLQGVAI